MKEAPHILVIDDENHICESCNRIFTDAGYKVDTNIHAGSGFQQAVANPYDAIILDLKLAESDGMSLLYGIRKKKPYIPVVIITGYPTDETRRMSAIMGVADYITKPFGPDEILEPLQRIITSETAFRAEEKYLPGKERNYHFYLSSWFYPIENGTVRVGGYLPNLSDSCILSVKLPEIGLHIRRGLTLAEVTLSNGKKQIIPSAISGKIIEVNSQLREHFYNLEKNLHHKSWIAIIEPDHLDEDLKTTEQRSVLVFADESLEENEFYQRIFHQGYKTLVTDRLESVIKILSLGKTRVLVMDASQMGESGPSCVRTLNRKMPDLRIIVFNDPNLQMEKKYRNQNIFYYGVNPILNNELIDLLHCAFSDDD